MLRDAFDILALPPRLDLAAPDIERAYLACIAQIHPDVAAAGDAGDGGEGQDLAAQVNDARKTLSDPLARAEALLARLRGPTASTDKSLPPGFLMEIMELRETVEADRALDDPRERETRRKAWSCEAVARREAFVARLAPMFEAAVHDASVLSAIRTQLNAWRYTERLIEQL